MTPTIRFCLVLHNHQPIGNFDGVFEQAYRDSYSPFLDVLESYPDLRISLHVSGSLLEWLDQHHGDYVDRLADFASAGRVEILGGAYYEPILTMLTSRDRIGQIRDYTAWLEQRLGANVQGMWVPERVWEQPLASDLADAGIRYTVLDDFHFRNAGLTEDRLDRYYITEDSGRLLSVFPGSERLRYLIPFGQPQETIDYLRSVAERNPGAVLVFGDDGEKFGVWPGTNKHVYQEGWLRRFFDALQENQQWLRVATLAEAVENAPPAGKVYLPDSSYREMTEWALPVDRQLEYESIAREMEHDGRWPRIRPFIRGGCWRNFKVKYPEANEMYSSMMMVSRKLEQAEREGRGGEDEDLRRARQALYRGQCNCAYWHGAFGGVYLPHLRNAIYHHLILADNWLDRAAGKSGAWIEAEVDDFNCDARQEVRLANDQIVCLLSPAAGGQLYELDVRSIGHNLLATLARRPEAYHEKVREGAHQGGDGVSSIHDRVVFKQEDLDQRLQYDDYLRKSLVDHFFDNAATLEAVSRGQAAPLGDFVQGVYDARLRRNPGRIQAVLTRAGRVAGRAVTITKGVTAQAGDGVLEIAYLLEGLPQDEPLHFGVEFNFALPAGADDRYFYRGERERLGQLGARLDLHDLQDLSLADEWLGLDIQLTANRPSGVWTYPVETVSQSEGGFELVHQSVVVLPHWLARGDSQGRWTVTMKLAMHTRSAQRPLETTAAAAST